MTRQLPDREARAQENPWTAELLLGNDMSGSVLSVLVDGLRSSKPVWGRILLVMLGGALGALCRYGVGLMAGRWIGSRFPWGTLLVNLVGCFLIGVSFAMVERTNLLSPSTRLFFMTGFLGALTTFSSYALETVNAIRSESGAVALMNILVNNLVGLALVVVGMWLVKTLRP